MSVATEPGTRRDVPEVQPVPQRWQRGAIGERRRLLVERRLQRDAAFGADDVMALLAAADPCLQVAAFNRIVDRSILRCRWPADQAAGARANGRVALMTP